MLCNIPDVSLIQVTNTIDVEVNLGGMVLKMMSDGFESSYKFTRAHKLAAGATFSVYSADSGVVHSVGRSCCCCLPCNHCSNWTWIVRRNFGLW